MKCKHKNKEIEFYTYKYISYYCSDCDTSFKRYDKKRIIEMDKEVLKWNEKKLLKQRYYRK